MGGARHLSWMLFVATTHYYPAERVAESCKGPGRCMPPRNFYVFSEFDGNSSALFQHHKHLCMYVPNLRIRRALQSFRWKKEQRALSCVCKMATDDGVVVKETTANSNSEHCEGHEAVAARVMVESGAMETPRKGNKSAVKKSPKSGTRNSSSQDGMVKTQSGVEPTTDASRSEVLNGSSAVSVASEPQKKKSTKKLAKQNDSVVAMIVEQSDEGPEVTENAKSEEEAVSGNKRPREESADAIDETDAKKKPMSKSAEKKAKKMERLALKKKEIKARQKEKRKEQREKKSQQWTNLSAEEKQAAVERSKEARKLRVEEGNKKKDKLKHALDAGLNLVIDLELCSSMKPHEVVSMGQQIMYSYAANAKANVPTRLSLTGLEGNMKEQLEKVPGYDRWFLHKEERPYLDVFADRKKDLVYLTADSENVLDRLDESKVYIIGGLVDHNRLKGVTLEKAKEQGISTARLPIQEHVKLATSTVLTVNQVVEIVLEFLDCKDWAKVLKAVIPQRKIVA